jgi:hypothetical protein
MKQSIELMSLVAIYRRRNLTEEHQDVFLPAWAQLLSVFLFHTGLLTVSYENQKHKQ